MATYDVTTIMDHLNDIISEARDIAQAINEFADSLERIEKKYEAVKDLLSGAESEG